jgi:hypothetical protein
MIRIAITPAAYATIAATLALGTVAVESEQAENGGVEIGPPSPHFLKSGRTLRKAILIVCAE